MDIGQRIKQKREELKMSQEELAKKAGYKSRSSINKIEIDGRGIPQSKIVAIATALGTTPAALMGWEDQVITLDELKKKSQINAWNDFIRLVESVGYEITELEDSLYEIVCLKYDAHIVITKEQLKSLQFTIMNFISYTSDKFFEDCRNK